MKTDLDFERFWEVNERCRALDSGIPRVPVDIFLPGDWICDLLRLDNSRYYSEYDYQQEQRLRCSAFTENELGLSIAPMVDFGVIMDASIYGGEVHYESSATPTLSPVVDDPSQIDGLAERMARTNLMEHGLVPSYMEWRDRIKRDFGVTLTYGDSIKGCATMLGQICGITNYMTWAATDPEQIAKLVRCWLETSTRYLREIRALTGFPPDRRGFSFASDLAGMLSPAMYRQQIMAAERELYDLFAPEPGDLRYYHADYHMRHHLDAFREMGVNAVNIDPYIDAGQILDRLPDAVVYGQIPPTKVLLYGSPEDVGACVRRDIAQAGPGRRLVVCPAGSINPGTSFANLRAICLAVEEYGYIY